MTSAFAVKFGHEHERFTINDERLGAQTKDVLTSATEKYSIEPTCTIEKEGYAVVKKAMSVQTCVYSSLQDVMLAGQRVIEARYQFINGRFEQLDLEIEEVTRKSKEALRHELTVSLDVGLEVEGPISRWSGKNDTAMLIRQGNYKFRMTNRVYLPDDLDYNKLTVRK